MSAVRVRSAVRRFVAATSVAALVVPGLSAAPAVGVTGCTVPPAVFPVSLMQRGMTGVGYTVIEGTTVEPFTVEILGVLPDAIFLGVDIVVARMTGPAAFIEETGGAVAGMSGSPIYINNRLAGALAWAVAEDRHIFGMTAAEDMVGIFDLADPTAAAPQRIRLPRSVIEAARAEGARLSDTATLESLPIPLGVSGLGGQSLDDIGALFAEHGVNVSPFRAASARVPSPTTIDPTRFVPGDGLGVALSYGDVSWYGFGTTTAVCGDIALGFGHPMFWGQGEVSLGMTDVEIFAIDNGTFWGTKIGTIGDTHGTLTEDRFAGVAGIFGVAPTLVPVTSDVSSPDTGLSRQGRTDIAWDEDWFVAEAAYYHAASNFTYALQSNGPGTVDYEFTIEGTREDGSPFTVSNRWFQPSEWSAADGSWRLIDFLYALAFNGYEPIAFTSIDLAGTVTDEVLWASIGRVRLSSPLQPALKERSAVRAGPGDRVTVEVTFVRAYGGPDVVETFIVKVPRGAGGDATVRLAGGRGRLDVYGEGVGSFDDLIAALNGGDHLNDLVVKAFGTTTLRPQDVGVQGRSRFVIQVVR